jgi:hypothetical protein
MTWIISPFAHDINYFVACKVPSQLKRTCTHKQLLLLLLLLLTILLLQVDPVADGAHVIP